MFNNPMACFLLNNFIKGIPNGYRPCMHEDEFSHAVGCKKNAGGLFVNIQNESIEGQEPVTIEMAVMGFIMGLATLFGLWFVSSLLPSVFRFL